MTSAVFEALKASLKVTATKWSVILVKKFKDKTHVI